MDSSFSLCASCNYEEALKDKFKFLHNFQILSMSMSFFEKNTSYTGFRARRFQK